LKQHIKMHRGEKPRSCPYCPYRCRQNSRLELHLRTHTGEKPDKCEICGMSFISKPSLKNHIKLVHLAMKPKQRHACSHCDKSYTEAHILKHHIRDEHSGNSQVACGICGEMCT